MAGERVNANQILTTTWDIRVCVINVYIPAFSSPVYRILTFSFD